MSASLVIWGISLEGWLTLAAIIAGPILALVAQRVLDRYRQSRQRKVFIFKELMATRATRLSPRHVEALNAIEIEFSSGSRSDRKVFDVWRQYLNHFDTTAGPNPDPAVLAAWGKEGSKLLVELLSAMASRLGYKFDKVSLEKSVYYPKGHVDLENEQAQFRRMFIELMDGKRAMWTGVFTGERPLQMHVTNLSDVGGPRASSDVQPKSPREDAGETNSN